MLSNVSRLEVSPKVIEMNESYNDSKNDFWFAHLESRPPMEPGALDLEVRRSALQLITRRSAF